MYYFLKGASYFGFNSTYWIIFFVQKETLNYLYGLQNFKFQKCWRNGESIIVIDVLKEGTRLSWDPMVTWRALCGNSSSGVSVNPKSEKVYAIDCFASCEVCFLGPLLMIFFYLSIVSYKIVEFELCRSKTYKCWSNVIIIIIGALKQICIWGENFCAHISRKSHTYSFCDV